MSDNVDAQALRNELQGLFTYIQRVRKEIAAMASPAEKDHTFHKMSDQLDAIVNATEEATNSIMEMMESNQDALFELRGMEQDPAKLALIDKITDNCNNVFEACSFQDITGQRVTKVFKSISYVEERVNALTDIWGKEALKDVKVEESKKTEDEKLLNGPQMQGEGISQDEIDKLFD